MIVNFNSPMSIKLHSIKKCDKIHTINIRWRTMFYGGSFLEENYPFSDILYTCTVISI